MRRIGIGHRLLPGEEFPTGITEAQAKGLLLKDHGRDRALPQ